MGSFMGKAYMYIMNSKSPRFDPWVAPCFSIHEYEKLFEFALDDFISSFFFLFVKYDLN